MARAKMSSFGSSLFKIRNDDNKPVLAGLISSAHTSIEAIALDVLIGDASELETELQYLEQTIQKIRESLNAAEVTR